MRRREFITLLGAACDHVNVYSSNWFCKRHSLMSAFASKATSLLSCR